MKKSKVRAQGGIEPAILGTTRCRLSPEPLLPFDIIEKLTLLYFESLLE
jgi:hypothetical protein